VTGTPRDTTFAVFSFDTEDEIQKWEKAPTYILFCQLRKNRITRQLSTARMSTQAAFKDSWREKAQTSESTKSALKVYCGLKEG
jgi:hypothetical protein